MKKEAVLVIRGRQSYDGQEPETIELTRPPLTLISSDWNGSQTRKKPISRSPRKSTENADAPKS